MAGDFYGKINKSFEGIREMMTVYRCSFGMHLYLGVYRLLRLRRRCTSTMHQSSVVTVMVADYAMFPEYIVYRIPPESQSQQCKL